ncbi:hypothetical protein J437_LFUL007921 [Ladona fulva]|uniref:MADF domain-containing protein n=1 Tax=Ladona fulva TaxID=123851 RepID=A0A8K0NYL4_LADFU|nr:hypothetical protein J437_LFUL007921 [Ladona fulva]
MEWSSKDVIRLIGAYRERPELWDHNDNNYKVLSRKNEAWNDIANMCGTDTLEVRRKMNSVLASFRRERKKVEMAKQGAGENDEVCSSWFGYEHLQFLIDKFRSRGSRELVSEGESKGSRSYDRER